jgi:hypothetical protein
MFELIDETFEQAVRNLRTPHAASNPFDDIFGGYQ